MGYLEPLLRPFLAGLLTALFLTPICRRLASRIGFLDAPATQKLHQSPTPRLGGPAIYTSLLLGLWIGGPTHPALIGIVGGATLLLLVGLVDDWRGLAPATKLGAQLLAASLAVGTGVQITFLGHPVLGIPLTLLWIIGITNAFNLLDNMDGLSAGIASIGAATFAVLAARYYHVGPEQSATAMTAGALAGACLGFLRYNIHQASIFMGDSGSLVVGFVLATLAALGSWHSPKVSTSILIPILVLAYPIFDTTLVTVLRWRRGQSIFEGGKDHSSHRLVNLGLGRTEAVFLIYLFALCHALTAALITSVTFRLSLLALAVSVSVLFIFGMVLRKAPI